MQRRVVGHSGFGPDDSCFSRRSAEWRIENLENFKIRSAPPFAHSRSAANCRQIRFAGYRKKSSKLDESIRKFSASCKSDFFFLRNLLFFPAIGSKNAESRHMSKN